MLLLKVILPGLAASILFWLLDKAVLFLPADARVGGMVAAFAIVTAASWWLLRADAGPRARVGSRNRVRTDWEADVSDSTISGPGDVEVLSGNKIDGKAKLSVRNLEIK